MKLRAQFFFTLAFLSSFFLKSFEQEYELMSLDKTILLQYYQDQSGISFIFTQITNSEPIYRYSKCPISNTQLIESTPSSKGISIKFKGIVDGALYPLIGIDLELYQEGADTISIQIGTISKQITSFHSPIIPSVSNYDCGSDTSIFSYSIESNSQEIYSNNHLNELLISKKQSNLSQQLIGLSSIYIWGTCLKNCETCIDLKCINCKIGFEYRKIENTYICSQFTDCTISNCQQCWKSKDAEICATCFDPYIINSSGICENTNTKSVSCSTSSYFDIQAQTCLQYSNISFYSTGSSLLTYYYNNYFQSFKCKSNLSVILYKIGGFQNFSCSCPIKNCISCLNEEDQRSCNKCQEGYSYDSYSNTCMPNCPSHQYYNVQLQECAKCGSNCLICTSLTDCRICDEGYNFNLQTRTCKFVCNKDQYYDRYLQKCLTCSVNFCEQCASYSDCFVCQQGYQRDDQNKCVNPCSSNQYYDQVTSSCKNCSVNCLTCTSSSCSTCQNSYLQDSDDITKCSKCKVENCQECQITAQNCKVCQSNYFLQSTSSSSSECVSCQVENCDTCEIYARKCKACKTNFYLKNISSQISQCIACQVQNCWTCSKDAYSCSKCLLNYNLLEGRCVSCQIENCLSCSSDSALHCQKCSSGYMLDADYSCIQIKDQEYKVVEATLKSNAVNNEGYTLILNFNSTVSANNTNITQLISLSISKDPKFSYEAELFENKSMNINIKAFTNIQNSIATIEFSDTFVSANSLKTKSITKELSNFIYVSTSTRQASAAAASVGSVASTAIISSFFPIVILSNFYVLVNTIDITGFLYYLLFINVRHPQNVIDFYSVFKNFQFPFIPNIFQGLVGANFTQVAPSKFTEQGTDLQKLSFFFFEFTLFLKIRYFLNNTGQTITIWIFIIGIYLIGKAFSYIPLPFLQSYLKESMEKTWECSSFLDLLWNTYVYALIGMFLQFYCYNSDDKSFIANYICHSICVIITLGAPFLVTWLIYREPDIKSSQNFKKNWGTLIGGVKVFDTEKNKSNLEEKIGQHIETIIQQENKNIEEVAEATTNEDKKIEAKSEKNPPTKNNRVIKNLEKKYSKYFFPLLYFRKVLFSIIIVYAHDYPEFQLSFIIILMSFMVLYLIIVQPLDSKSENIKNCAGEFCLIAICICIFFLVKDDDVNGEFQRIKVGWAIVFFSGFILLWHTLQLIKETLQLIYNLFKRMFMSVISLLKILNNKEKECTSKEDHNLPQTTQPKQSNPQIEVSFSQKGTNKQNGTKKEEIIDINGVNMEIKKSGILSESQRYRKDESFLVKFEDEDLLSQNDQLSNKGTKQKETAQTEIEEPQGSKFEIIHKKRIGLDQIFKGSKVPLITENSSFKIETGLALTNLESNNREKQNIPQKEQIIELVDQDDFY